MSKAGWYPDPGGQQGMFRWWDGTQWTPQVTAHPYALPPQANPMQPFAAPTGLGPMPMQDGQAPHTQPTYDYASYDTSQQRSSRGPLLTLAAVALVLVALIVGSIYLLGGGRLGPLGGGDQPASNPTADVCPRQSAQQISPVPHVNPPGRVQGGKLSYPLLGSPWGGVKLEPRVPFGRDVYGQDVMVEPNYAADSSWVASITVGELVAGDGFFSPEQGADIITRCVLGRFYGDAEIDRTDRVNQATTIDGRDAWLVEMHLTFDIRGLKEKGETAIVIVVATGTESSSLFYASIPDSRPELLATARQVQGQLRVEG